MRQLSTLLISVALVAATYATLIAQGVPSEDEAAIKKTLQTMIGAVNKDDMSNMLAQYSDDAKIYSRVVNGQVSKDKYAEIMTDVFKRGDLISAEIRDMTITMTDPSRATVLGTVFLVTRTGRPSGRAEYKLEKRDGRWVIVETMAK